MASPEVRDYLVGGRVEVQHVRQEGSRRRRLGLLAHVGAARSSGRGWLPTQHLNKQEASWSRR